MNREIKRVFDSMYIAFPYLHLHLIESPDTYTDQGNPHALKLSPLFKQ